MIRYKCIECNDNIEFINNIAECKKCNKKYYNSNGIKSFNEETNYYGDLTEKNMKILLNEMENTYWKKLIYDRFGNSNPFLYYMITDNNRADWQYLIPLNNESLVLDIGAGWGTLTMPLASRSKVVALDGTYDRLNFVKKRAKQEQQDNIIDFVNANVLKLPFDEKQFDLVVMNGVLEWVGASVNEGDPYELQLEALNNVNKILKNNGYVYIGIENMMGLKYLIGAEDDHTLIPDICYLDRKEADKYSNKVHGKNYRTYTYDKSGYEKMLEKAGFKCINFYYPYPDYKTINSIMELDNQTISFFNENIDKKLNVNTFNGRVQSLQTNITKQGNIENYVSSYGIIAKKVE